MDYISEPGRCWAEETDTGRVLLIGRSPWNQRHFDTPHGHRWELWQAIDLDPARVWASEAYELYPGTNVVVTLFVDLQINGVYIMVPSILGSTIKITSGSHGESVDACRKNLCESVMRLGTFAPAQVRDLFRALSRQDQRKLQDVATVALATLTPTADEICSGLASTRPSYNPPML